MYRFVKVFNFVGFLMQLDAMFSVVPWSMKEDVYENKHKGKTHFPIRMFIAFLDTKYMEKLIISV